VAEVLKSYNDHIEMINKVRQRRRDEFMASFRKITIKLKEMYQMITLGGDAELELVDSLDPFSEGINFRFVYLITLNSKVVDHIMLFIHILLIFDF